MNNKKKLTTDDFKSIKLRNARMKGKVNLLVPEIKVDSPDSRLMRYVALGLCDVKFYDLEERRLVDEIEAYKEMYIQIRPMVSTTSYKFNEPMYTPSNDASKILSKWLNKYSTNLIQFDNPRPTDEDKPKGFDISLGEMKERFSSTLISESELEEFNELLRNTFEFRMNDIDLESYRNSELGYFKSTFSQKSIMKLILGNSIDVPAEDIEWFSDRTKPLDVWGFTNEHGRKPKISEYFLKNLLLANWRVDKDLVLHNYKLTKESVLGVVQSVINENASYEEIQHYYHFDFSYIALMNYQDFKPAEWMKMFRLNNKLPPRVVPEETRKHFTPMMIKELVEINPLVIYDWGLFHLYEQSEHRFYIELRVIYPFLPIDKQLDPKYYLELPSDEVHQTVKDILKEEFYPELLNFPHHSRTVKNLFNLVSDEGKVILMNNYIDFFNIKEFLDCKDLIDNHENDFLPEVKKVIKSVIYNNFRESIDLDIIPKFIGTTRTLLEEKKKSPSHLNDYGFFEVISSDEMDIIDKVKELGTFVEKGENLNKYGVEIEINDDIDFSIKYQAGATRAKILETGAVSIKVGQDWFNKGNIDYCFEFTVNREAFESCSKSKGKSYDNKEDRDIVLECLITEQKKKLRIELDSKIKKRLKFIETWNRVKISPYMRKKAKTNLNRHFVLARMNQEGLVSIFSKKNIFIIDEHGLENYDKALFNENLSNRILPKEEHKKKVVKI